MRKAERERIRAMFDGRCAYCGCILGERWHADHVEPLIRKMEHVQGKGFVTVNACHRPENARADNLFPSCVPCNIDKHSNTIEGWRWKLQRSCEVLSGNSSTYRHAKRFGLLSETGAKIVFYFEQCAALTDQGRAGEGS